MIKLPEPAGQSLIMGNVFTADQLKQAIRDALEEAAKVCDRLSVGTMDAQQGPPETLSNVMLRQVAVLGHGECATAIRKLKEDM